MVGFWTLGDGVRAVWAVVVGSGGGFAGVRVVPVRAGLA